MTNKAIQQDLGKLVEEYQPKLRAFIRKRVNSLDDAEDILQDVLYQLVKAVDATKNPIEQVSAWLFKVARNTIINKGKKKKEQKLPTLNNPEQDNDLIKDFAELLTNDEEIAPSPEMCYLRSLVWTELDSALAELPVEQREVFELTELDGIPVKEIAAATGTPINTLLSRKHYAILHLRNRLAELYNDIVSS